MGGRIIYATDHLAVEPAYHRLLPIWGIPAQRFFQVGICRHLLLLAANLYADPIHSFTSFVFCAWGAAAGVGGVGGVGNGPFWILQKGLLVASWGSEYMKLSLPP